MWGNYEGDLLTASPSKIVCLRKCPEFYKHRYIDKLDEKTDSMEFGTLVHMALLEPEKFKDTYCAPPTGIDLTVAELKEKCRTLGLSVAGTKKELITKIRAIEPLEKTIDEAIEELESSGKRPLSPAIWAKVEGIKKSLESHEQIGKFLEFAEKEKRGYWLHPEGVVLNFSVDAFVNYKDTGIIMDFKVTKDWEPHRFKRALFEDGKHILAAAYSRAISEIEGFKFNHFIFIAIEPTAPHRIRFYRVDDASLEKGSMDLDQYVSEWKTRTLAHDWSARDMDSKIQDISLPDWAW